MRFSFAVLAACLVLGSAGCSRSLQLLSVTSVTPNTLAAGSAATVITVTGT